MDLLYRHSLVALRRRPSLQFEAVLAAHACMKQTAWGLHRLQSFTTDAKFEGNVLRQSCILTYIFIKLC